MQQYILSKKNVITVISGLLIALGFFSHFVLENVGLSEWSLIIASVFGITPIAIQAFQAMKVSITQKILYHHMIKMIGTSII